MPRPPRLVVPNVPLHITQRGVDRCPTFLQDDDFAFYRWALCEALIDARCAVHAYVLMTNHVHLLVTPADGRGPERLMRSLGRQYVRVFNDRYRRTGTLWEGRFRSALVKSSAHFFACMRYIELNPVRAGLVADPGAYEWSSFRHNALGGDDSIITPHPSYLAMGAEKGSRCSSYRALFDRALEPMVIAAIRATLRARPTLQRSEYQQAIATLSEDPAPRWLEQGTVEAGRSGAVELPSA